MSVERLLTPQLSQLPKLFSLERTLRMDPSIQSHIHGNVQLLVLQKLLIILGEEILSKTERVLCDLHSDPVMIREFRFDELEFFHWLHLGRSTSFLFLPTWCSLDTWIQPRPSWQLSVDKEISQIICTTLRLALDPQLPRTALLMTPHMDRFTPSKWMVLAQVSTVILFRTANTPNIALTLHSKPHGRCKHP